MGNLSGFFQRWGEERKTLPKLTSCVLFCNARQEEAKRPFYLHMGLVSLQRCGSHKHLQMRCCSGVCGMAAAGRLGPEGRVCPGAAGRDRGGIFVWPSLPDIFISIFSRSPRCVLQEISNLSVVLRFLSKKKITSFCAEVLKGVFYILNANEHSFFQTGAIKLSLCQWYVFVLRFARANQRQQWYILS